MLLTLADIFFPALDALQRDLGVSDLYITANVAIFILFQGTVPILWSTISEVKGRKLVYICSMTLYVVGCAVASQAQNGPVFVCLMFSSSACADSDSSLCVLYPLLEAAQYYR